MEHEPHIPERLAGDLRRVYRGEQGAGVRVPGEVDGRVLAAATDLAKPSSVARNRSTRHRMPLRWRVVKWVGMAAAVVLTLIVPTQLSRNSQAPVVAVSPDDVNGDGAVDILDAFALARAMRDGEAGVVKADVDAAVARAVRLAKGGTVGGGA